MSALQFTAKARTTTGSAASRRIRRETDLPGIVYGRDMEPQAVTCSHHEIYQLMKNEKFHSSIITMNFDGKAQKVLLRDYQSHPYKQQLMHIDFQAISGKREIHMTVPLHFVGEENSPGVKLAHGLPSHVMIELEIACMPDDLPSHIEVDMSAMEMGDAIHVGELKLPKGVRLSQTSTTDHVVCAVIAPVAEEVDAVAPAAATEAAPVAGKADAKAAPAAAAKPAAKPAAKK